MTLQLPTWKLLSQISLISALSLEGCVVLIGTHLEYPFDPLDHK